MKDGFVSNSLISLRLLSVITSLQAPRIDCENKKTKINRLRIFLLLTHLLLLKN